MDQVELAIRMTADADNATRAVDGVGDAFGRMAADVDQATARADSASSRLDSVADSTDNMASRSSQAAGGIGDLAGALEQTGFISEGTAMAMEGASAAIMGVTGASDLLNLVTTSSLVVKAKDRAATIAQAVSSRAAAVATRAQAVAQRVLNAAMRANPLGIVLGLLAGLVALVVLAYKRSETFRRIIDRAWSVAKAGALAVIRVLGQVVSWITGRLGGAWSGLQEKAARVWQSVRDAAGRAMEWVREKVSSIVGRVKDILGGIGEKVSGVASGIRDALGGAFDWVMGKLQPILDKVTWLLDKLPGVDLGGKSRAVPPGRTLARTTTTDQGLLLGGGDVYYIDVRADAFTDLDALARRLERVLRDRGVRMGRA